MALVVVSTLLIGSDPAQGATGKYIVVLRDGVSIQAHLKAMKITPNRLYTSAATGYEAVLNDTQYRRVLASPDTTIVTPDAVVATVPTVQAPPADPIQPPQIVSNGVRRIGGLLSPTAAIDGIDTRIGVDVAIVDTGVDPIHPDLNVVGGVDCVSSKGQGNNGAFVDKAGHGTLVAGFVGAVDNAIGVVGPAPGARIWAVQVNSGRGAITNSALMCAADWITANADTIEIANLSLSGPLRPNVETENCGVSSSKLRGDALHAAICASVAAGVTYVVAAGNASVDASTVIPGSYDEVIAVSALTDLDGQPGGLQPPVRECSSALNAFHPIADDTLVFFSNFGADVDLAAPGVCISSTYPGGLYVTGSGTSFASPLVAGAAALYISTHPGATPAQVRAALVAAAEPGPIPGDPDAFPEGIVNVSTF
jgi:subtilisin family serine protease